MNKALLIIVILIAFCCVTTGGYKRYVPGMSGFCSVLPSSVTEDEQIDNKSI